MKTKTKKNYLTKSKLQFPIMTSSPLFSSSLHIFFMKEKRATQSGQTEHATPTCQKKSLNQTGNNRAENSELLN